MEADKIFRWEGPKRKQTLFGATLGRLVLTDQRLLFLSTGKNDVNAKRLLMGAVSPLAGLRTSSTTDLDLSGLTAKGGLEIPLTSVTSAALKGMFKTMTIVYSQADSVESTSVEVVPRSLQRMAACPTERRGLPRSRSVVEPLGTCSRPLAPISHENSGGGVGVIVSV